MLTNVDCNWIKKSLDNFREIISTQMKAEYTTGAKKSRQETHLNEKKNAMSISLLKILGLKQFPDPIIFDSSEIYLVAGCKNIAKRVSLAIEAEGSKVIVVKYHSDSNEIQ